MEKLKVAIQGVAGAFHEEAARKFYGDDIELVECSAFRLLCQKLAKGEADYAVMAIENTIAGSILQNYSLVGEYQFHIIGEVYLRIQMNLMALEGVSIEQLQYLYSHPMALHQCADFIATLPPSVKVLEADDTAESAKLIAQNRLTDTAAIASMAAARLYGLNVLEKGIETVKQNYTRFIALSRQPADSTDSSKASLSIELRQVGALAEALAIFTAHGINLTKIQSVPILGKPYQYAFHIDVEWTERSAYRQALTELLRTVASLSVYGEYEKGSMK